MRKWEVFLSALTYVKDDVSIKPLVSRKCRVTTVQYLTSDKVLFLLQQMRNAGKASQSIKSIYQETGQSKYNVWVMSLWHFL